MLMSHDFRALRRLGKEYELLKFRQPVRFTSLHMAQEFIKVELFKIQFLYPITEEQWR